MHQEEFAFRAQQHKQTYGVRCTHWKQWNRSWKIPYLCSWSSIDFINRFEFWMTIHVWKDKLMWNNNRQSSSHTTWSNNNVKCLKQQAHKYNVWLFHPFYYDTLRSDQMKRLNAYNSSSVYVLRLVLGVAAVAIAAGIDFLILSNFCQKCAEKCAKSWIFKFLLNALKKFYFRWQNSNAIVMIARQVKIDDKPDFSAQNKAAAWNSVEKKNIAKYRFPLCLTQSHIS